MFFRFKPRKNWQERVAERVFRDRKPVEEKLIPFGFVPGGSGFSYRAELMGGAFYAECELRPNGSVHVAVCGAGEGAGDVPPLASSSFLARQLRKEFEEELWHVAECCFEPDVFKAASTQRVLEYVRTVYGDAPEHLWRRSPESAIVRRRDNAKWYAVFQAVPRLKLGGSSDERVEILNLRVRPDELEGCVDYVSRFPGYHMNKKHWVSLCLDGSVPFEELKERLEASYRLALK